MTNVLWLWRIFDAMTSFLLSWHFFIISGTKYNENVFAIITNFWMSWHVFHVMTHLLTSWQTLDVMVCFWCYDELCDAVFFLCDKTFYIMTYFWTNDGFVFGSNDEPFTITNLLTSWQTFWHYDVFLISWQTFGIFLTSWQIFWRHDKLFGVMASCWRHGELFEVMTNLLSSWRILTSWRTCWRQGKLFDVMTF